jgi:histidinol-phosphate aminotransferase
MANDQRLATTNSAGLRGLVRPDLLEMEPYTAVQPVDVVAARLGVPEERIVKLDANENLYGPSPGAREAVARVRDLHIYPDPDQAKVRDAIGSYLGVPPELVVAGVGSDELIQVIATIFAGPGDRILNLVPTFGMYDWAAAVVGAELVNVRRRDDFTVDIDAVYAAIDDRTKLIFVASPNNPTGNAISRSEFRALVDTGLAVVIDEAYAEFAGENYTQFVVEHENLIGLRTMSKWAGLAGMRIGYGVFPASIVDIVRTVRQPYSFSVAAQAALLASLEDRGFLLERVALLVAERERLHRELSTISFLRPHPSQANFVFTEVVGREAKAVRDELQQQGIFVRYYSNELIRNYLRVGVGLPEHTDRLIAALRDMEGAHA